MRHPWRRNLALALALATIAVQPAHGDEAEIVIERDVEETTRLLRRDTNLVVIYGPDGTAEVRTYADGDGSETSAEEPDETARLRAQALGSADAGERASALHALLGSEVGLQTALDVLARDREAEVLKNALDVLTGYPTLPLDPIFTAVRNEDPGVRIQALELLTLHRERDPRVADVIARAAASDDDEAVRETARALIGTGDSR